MRDPIRHAEQLLAIDLRYMTQAPTLREAAARVRVGETAIYAALRAAG